MAIPIMDAWRRNGRWAEWLALALGALTAVAATFGDAPAAARTIENIAYARWTEAGVAAQVQSNQVAVTLASPAMRLETYRLAPDSETSLAIIPSRCLIAPESAPAEAQTLRIEPASHFRAGEVIVFALDAPKSNRDPGAVDSIRITVSSPKAQVELIVHESAPCLLYTSDAADE